MNDFCKSLKKYMIDNDINQKQIAEITGLSKQAISNLFNRDNLSLEKMMLLATACNCKLQFVFTPLDNNSK